MIVAAVYRIVLCSILGVTNAIAISEQGMSGVFLLTLIIVVAWLVALWTRFGSGMGVVGAGAARTGSFGLELSGGSGPTSVFHDIGGLAPGQNYQVTAFVRRLADNGTASLWVHDTTGANASPSQSAPASSSFEPLVLPYTANATGAVRIHLVYGGEPGTVAWDDVALSRPLPVWEDIQTAPQRR